VSGGHQFTLFASPPTRPPSPHSLSVLNSSGKYVNGCLIRQPSLTI
jgi:hypothetical protein